MPMEKSRLPWACELDKGSGWVETCLPAVWHGPGQGRGQQSKDLLPVPTCAPQLWALCYLVDALSSSGLFSLQVSIVFILARTITTALLHSILFLFP